MTAAPELSAGLYPVATPIGNLRDITLRALDVLAAADAVICEDTRVTGRLLAAHGISTPKIIYHDHSGEAARAAILDRLAAGQALALACDAGTPTIADPGFKLVRDAAQAGHAIHPIPGPCAAMAALCGGGLPTDRFLFAGFLPPRSAARTSALRALGSIQATLVFYESPRRLAACLRDMATLWPGRDAVVARELTKVFEIFRRAPLPALADAVGEEPTPRGEVVVLVGPPAIRAEASQQDIQTALRAALSAGQSARDAVAMVSAATGAPRQTVYRHALALLQEREE